MAEALPHFPPFDISDEPGAKGPRWKKYVTRFKNLMVAGNITDAARQRALLLHYAGEDTNEIFDTLPNTEAAGDENTLTKAIDALTVHFEDKKNIVFEEYQFRQARQEDDKTIQAYHTRLKKLAQTCEFADVDREIKAQVIQHCTSTKLRRKGLNDPTVSLNDLLDYGRTLELTETRIIDLEQSDKAVNKLRHTTGTKRHFNSNTRDNHRKPNAVPKPTQGHKKHNDKKETEGKPRKSNSTCRNCGKNTQTKGECLNATIDHFTVVCLVAWPLNVSEAGVDLVLIETLLLFICKFLLISMRTASLT